MVRAAAWSPRGDRIVFAAAEHGRGIQLYRQAIGGALEAISPEGFDLHGDAVSPDGEQVAALGPGDQLVVWPVGGGEPREVRGATPGDVASGWTADGRHLYVFRRGELPGRVFRLELASGSRQLWRSFMPPDAAGVGSVSSVLVTPDGATAVYSYEQTLSELYLVENLR